MDRAISPAHFTSGAVVRIGGVGFVTTVLLWLLFTTMLFIAEPLFLHRRLLDAARAHPEQTYRRIERMRWTFLTISLVTLAAAAAGCHG